MTMMLDKKPAALFIWAIVWYYSTHSESLFVSTAVDFISLNRWKEK